MHRRLERFYYRSPVLLQNIAVSAYGWKLRRERYGPTATRHLRSLQRSAGFSVDQMQQLLDERFAAMVGHALATVPYWRNWARESGAVAGDFRRLDDLPKLPILSKDSVRAQGELFLSDVHAGRRGLIRLHTSGTSGKPLTVVCDREARTRHYAFFSRLRRWFDLDERSRRATLFGRVVVDPDQDEPPFWRYDSAQRNLLMSSYHLSPANVGRYADKLRRFQPEEVIGYPSSIYQIARHILTSDEPRLAPRVVITTAESLLDHQRESIEEAFDCPVVDQYGCTEMAFFASQCEQGTMHVHPEHGWLESLDAHDRPAASGATGRCIATGLINEVMPLLRYEIGDLITLGSRDCPCGRAFPVIARVEGRTDDVIVTPGGRTIGRMDPIFKGCRGLVECQIVQTEIAVLEFRLVADGSFDAQAERSLREQIRLRVGDQMQVRLRRVESIPRGKNGKFKAVIRLV